MANLTPTVAVDFLKGGTGPGPVGVTRLMADSSGNLSASIDGGAFAGIGGLSAAQTVQLPNSVPALVTALELDTTLTTNTPGAEVSRWVIKLLKAGVSTNFYQFDPDTFTMSSGIAKIAFPNSSMFQDISLVNLNFTMFGDFVIGAAGALATNATRGFIQVPTCAGPPTGSLAGLTAGKAAFVYDTTNSKWWGSAVAGTWKGVVLA